MDDFRIRIGFATHPKFVKLERRLGPLGRLAVIDLWNHCAAFQRDGDLTNMSDEDIAIAARWNDDPTKLIRALIEVHLLDESEDGYRVHKWESHQPYVAGASEVAEQKSLAGIKSGEARRAKSKRLAELEAAQTNGCSTGVQQVFNTVKPSLPSYLPTNQPTNQPVFVPPAAASPEAADDPDPDSKTKPPPDLTEVSRRIGIPIKLVSQEDAERLDRSLAAQEESLGLSQIEEILCSPPSAAGPIPHGKKWPLMGGHVLRDLMPVKAGDLPIIADAVRRTEDACERPNWVYLGKAIRGGREQRLRAPAASEKPCRLSEAGCRNGSAEVWKPPERQRPSEQSFSRGMGMIAAMIGGL